MVNAPLASRPVSRVESHAPRVRYVPMRAGCRPPEAQVAVGAT
jgi:hypothetical protein